MGDVHTAKAELRLATGIALLIAACCAMGCDLTDVPAKSASDLDDAAGEARPVPLVVTWPDGVPRAGFGKGLSSLVLKPRSVAGLEFTTAARLKGVDATYLELITKVNIVEREPNEDPRKKADAWCELASYAGRNPLKKLAEDRRDAWNEVADDLDKLLAQYRADSAELEKLIALDDSVLSKAQKAVYQHELDSVYAPWEPELEIALGEPTPRVKAAREKERVSSRLGQLRVDFSSGLDAQRLSYDAKDSRGNELVDPAFWSAKKMGGRHIVGDAGSSQGFVGAEISLPRLLLRGLGLSAIGRYAFGNEVSRITAGAGVKGFVLSDDAGTSALTVGAYVSYAKLLKVKDGAACDVAKAGAPDSGKLTLACLEQDHAVVDGSNGGIDVRLTMAYDIALGRFFQLSLGGSVGYEAFPYRVEGVDRAGRLVRESDTANGVGATLDAGLGLRL